MSLTRALTTALVPLVAILATALLPARSAPAATHAADEYAELRARAEALHETGSYARALELYEQAAELELEPAQRLWVRLRRADCAWRSAASSENPDATQVELARAALEELARELEPDKERTWAEVQESLGDLAWDRQRGQNQHVAWPYYRAALAWWGGSTELDLARERYLEIVWTMARPAWYRAQWSYGYYGNWIDADILENAVEIARTEADRARAHYLLAQSWGRADVRQRARVVGHYEQAIALGRGTSTYDDALYALASWWESQGEWTVGKDGQWSSAVDYVRAVTLYRRLVSEFGEGESRHRDDALRRIEELTGAKVGSSVDHVFLPGSKIQYRLEWRNVERVDLALYAADLTRDVGFGDGDIGASSWLSELDAKKLERVRSWSHATGDEGEHVPGAESLVLEGELAPGAYLLEATARGASARAFVLVSDASLVLKSTHDTAVVWFSDATDGEPIAKADVTLWERYHADSRWRWRERRATTDADGLARFDVGTRDGSHVELFVAARSGARQAFTTSGTPYRHGRAGWRIYATTDRPAYRPGDLVRWKITARTYDGDVYSTPANETLRYRLHDPRGAQIEEGELALNAFGSAWGEIETDETRPLGEYTIHFERPGAGHVGGTTLYRLEEYKLPEMQVSVSVAEEDGRPKLFRVGDEVEVEIEAEYYFGGPVADAVVEVLVYQRPYWHHWVEPRRFPWFYDDRSSSIRWWGGPGELREQKTLRTDAEGRARLAFQTPPDANQSLEYTFEVRVTDASRREVTKTETVRVTQQAYFVHPELDHRLFLPGDEVEVNFTAVDANRNPVSAPGAVRVTREQWVEIWRDPNGRQVTGEELERLRAKPGPFPPPSEAGWELVSRAYVEREVVHTAALETDAEGRASTRLVVAKDGFYRVTWTGRDERGDPIAGETTFWTCTSRTSELGYRSGGVEIVVDKDTFRAGDEAPVMLSVANSNRWVLFTVESSEIHDVRVVHVSGNVKLLKLPIGEKHVPNVFLSAVALDGGQVQSHHVEVIVPPLDHFLDVTVSADAEEYRPGDTGTLEIVAKDVDGRPVASELSLAVVDASVLAIQQSYALDPRQFFFGEKRSLNVHTQATAFHSTYARLIEGEKGEIVLDAQAAWGSEGDVQYDERLQDREEASVGGLELRAAGRGGSKAAAESSDYFLGDSDAMAPASAPNPEPSGALADVVVRTDFRETALWVPDVTTDADGRATVDVTYPDSTTRWETTVRAADTGARFGQGSATTRTSMPLLVRLQAPRFFVVGDEIVLSANLNNNTEAPLEVTPELAAQGLELVGYVVDGALRSGDVPPLTVPAGGSERVDWRVRVTEPGTARVRVTGRSAEHADGMERAYEIWPHGVESQVATAGKSTGPEAAFVVSLPAERAPGSTRFEVQVAPSLAVTMLDALPYLVRYPYGCTEQTLSRFLPAVVVAQTLADRGLSAEDAMERVFGGIERAHVDRTHPQERVSLARLDEVVAKGLTRLADFQHADGGWGWWKGGSSDRYMSAYAVWGLTLARESGADVDAEMLRRGAAYLDVNLVEEEERPDMLAWLAHALAVYADHTDGGHEPQHLERALDDLWRQHTRLNAFTRALAALAMHHHDRGDQARILAANLANGAIVDDAPESSLVQRGGGGGGTPYVQRTAHWGEDGVVWRWSDGGVEATAFALRALLAIAPEHELVEPATNWLIRNRRGAQWKSTRDTAIVVLALNDYLETSGELGRSVAYELVVNGEQVASRTVTPEEILAAPSTYAIDDALVRSGDNEIVLRRTGGEGPLYFAARATFFSTEEPVEPRGHGVFGRRQYYRLVARPTLLDGVVYERVPLADGERVVSGERVEVVLTIEAKNHLEYLVFEDLKPAGLEATQVKSGEPAWAQELKSGEVDHRYGDDGAAWESEVRVRPGGAPRQGTDLAAAPGRGTTGRTIWLHQELRDRKVAFFVDQMPQGVWEIRYDLRAEVPGEFHALPLLGHAMYVPEIRCNGAEVRIGVDDRDDV